MITILSDTHGNYDTWKPIFKDYMEKSSHIIHCGDLFFGGNERSTKNIASDILYMESRFYIAKGNCDNIQDINFIKNYNKDYGVLDAEGLRIVFTHGHNYNGITSKYYLAEENQADIVVSGHTHVPVCEYYHGILIANPGSHNNPRTTEQYKSFMTIENGIVKHIDIETGINFSVLDLKVKT